MAVSLTALGVRLHANSEKVPEADLGDIIRDVLVVL